MDGSKCVSVSVIYIPSTHNDAATFKRQDLNTGWREQFSEDFPEC